MLLEHCVVLHANNYTTEVPVTYSLILVLSYMYFVGDHLHSCNIMTFNMTHYGTNLAFYSITYLVITIKMLLFTLTQQHLFYHLLVKYTYYNSFTVFVIILPDRSHTSS